LDIAATQSGPAAAGVCGVSDGDTVLRLAVWRASQCGRLHQAVKRLYISTYPPPAKP